MSRRRRVSAVAFLLTAVLAGVVVPAADRRVAGAEAHPNVVVILTDDQRWTTLPIMQTVERTLVARGVRFVNAFVSTPVCCPSRATYLTGLYANHTGVWRNASPNGGFSAFDDTSTLATWFHDAGYRTAHIGKYLEGYVSTGGTYVPPGWDDWHTFTSAGYYGYQLSDNGVNNSYGSTHDQYSTDVLAKAAGGFIRGTPEASPLLLWFAPYAPHEPATPASRDVGAFDGIEPFRSRAYNERDVSDKPTWVQLHRWWGVKRRSEMDAFRQKQLETLLAADRAILTVLRALHDTGRLHDTIIVFASDNGYLWGEHRLAGKYQPYEESIRVPFVLRWDQLDLVQGVRRELVANADLAPTLADLAGVSSSPTDGLSLRPLLTDTAESWRRYFLLERLAELDISNSSYCGVRGANVVFVHYEDGEEEFYRLERDPYERKNLAADASWSRRIDALRDQTRSLCDPLPPGMPAF